MYSGRMIDGRGRKKKVSRNVLETSDETVGTLSDLNGLLFVVDHRQELIVEYSQPHIYGVEGVGSQPG